MNPVKTWLSSDCFLCNDLDCRLSSIDKFINFFKNYILTFSSNCSLFSSLENNKMKVIKSLPVFLCKGLVDPGFSSFTILQDNSFKIDSYHRDIQMQDLIFHFCMDSACNWECNIRENSGIFYKAILNKINWMNHDIWTYCKQTLGRSLASCLRQYTWTCCPFEIRKSKGENTF